MDKGGTISISFGMIFSIILIIAIIGVSFYAISYFLNLSTCTEISLFYDEFQKEVDRAWNSEITKKTFSSRLPRKIESVCFYDEGAIGTGEEYQSLKDYFRTRSNMFMYPPEKSCSQESKKVEHVDLSELGWHCFESRNGEITIPLEKGSFDSLVRIKRE